MTVKIKIKTTPAWKFNAGGRNLSQRHLLCVPRSTNDAKISKRNNISVKNGLHVKTVKIKIKTTPRRRKSWKFNAGGRNLPQRHLFYVPRSTNEARRSKRSNISVKNVFHVKITRYDPTIEKNRRKVFERKRHELKVIPGVVDVLGVFGVPGTSTSSKFSDQLLAISGLGLLAALYSCCRSFPLVSMLTRKRQRRFLSISYDLVVTEHHVR